MIEPQCRRCGRCCYVLKDGKWVKCRYLVKLSNGKSLCRTYNNKRIGKDCGSGARCGFRYQSEWNFKDCPYNELYPDKPIAPNFPY